MLNNGDKRLLIGHFAHRFCDLRCTDAYAAKVDQVAMLFNEEPAVWADCLQCEATLESNSSQGFGHKVSSAYETQLSVRRMIFLKQIPDDGKMMIGYRRNMDEGTPMDIGKPLDLDPTYVPKYVLQGTEKKPDPDPKRDVKNNNIKSEGAKPTTMSDPLKKNILDRAKTTVIADLDKMKVRAGAKQAIRLGTDLITTLVGPTMTPQAAEGLKAFLESPLGKAVAGYAISLGVNQLPEAMISEPEIQALIEEVRVGPGADAIDHYAEVVMEPVRKFTMTYLASMRGGKSGPALGGGDKAAGTITDGSGAEEARVDPPKRERRRKNAAGAGSSKIHVTVETPAVNGAKNPNAEA